MNSRDRVNAAIGHRPHDRVPRHETFWGDTLNRWAAEGLRGGEAEALKALGTDMVNVFPWGDATWPAPFPGRNELLSEDAKTRVFRDEWGATLRAFKDHQTTPEHIGWECDSPDAWRQQFRDRIRDTVPALPLERMRAAQARADNEQLWGFITAVEPFECMRKLIGDVEAMMAIKEEPDWIAEIAATTTDRSIRTWERALAAGIRPDGLWIYGDMAFNHATFCSPADYRALIWPQHKRMCDWAHARGLKTIYHTDGNINGVIDLYIEAGVDVLQPLECKAGMDIRGLAPKYGDRLSFFGNIDVMVLIRGDLGEIEAEIKSKFAAGMATRGYIYHSDHSIPPQVSWLLYQRIIQLVEKHGRYV